MKRNLVALGASTAFLLAGCGSPETSSVQSAVQTPVDSLEPHLDGGTIPSETPAPTATGTTTETTPPSAGDPIVEPNNGLFNYLGIRANSLIAINCDKDPDASATTTIGHLPDGKALTVGITRQNVTEVSSSPYNQTVDFLGGITLRNGEGYVPFFVRSDAPDMLTRLPRGEDSEYILLDTSLGSSVPGLYVDLKREGEELTVTAACRPK